MVVRGTVAPIVKGVDEWRCKHIAWCGQKVIASLRVSMFKVCHNLCGSDGVVCVVVRRGDLLCDALDGVSGIIVYLYILGGGSVMSLSGGDFVCNAVEFLCAWVDGV